MRDILQTIGGVLAIASMLFWDVFVIKTYISSNRDKESKQWLSHGIVLGTALGIIIFVLFDGISMLF